MQTTLDLATALEAARQRGGISKQDLAALAGVSRQAVFRLFSGSDVQMTTLLAIADALQLDVVALPRAVSASVVQRASIGEFGNNALAQVSKASRADPVQRTAGPSDPQRPRKRPDRPQTLRDSASDEPLSAVQMQLRKARARLAGKP